MPNYGYTVLVDIFGPALDAPEPAENSPEVAGGIFDLVMVGYAIILDWCTESDGHAGDEMSYEIADD